MAPERIGPTRPETCLMTQHASSAEVCGLFFGSVFVRRRRHCCCSSFCVELICAEVSQRRRTENTPRSFVSWGNTRPHGRTDCHGGGETFLGEFCRRRDGAPVSRFTSNRMLANNNMKPVVVEFYSLHPSHSSWSVSKQPVYLIYQCNKYFCYGEPSL